MRNLSVHQAQFDPLPVDPGPFGWRYSIFDHREIRCPLAKATWGERLSHAPNASRFLPKFSFSVSTIGLLILVLIGTFVMQEMASRLAAGFTSQNSGLIRSFTQLLGLFGPLLLIGVFILVAIFVSALRVWMPAVARYWLSIGQCASCRYDLSGVAVAADGCTVCPECGAAWRLMPTISEPPTSVGEAGGQRD